MSISQNWSSICCSADGVYVYACVYDGNVYKCHAGFKYDFVPIDTLGIGNWSEICCDLTGQYACIANVNYVYCSVDFGNSWKSFKMSNDTYLITASLDIFVDVDFAYFGMILFNIDRLGFVTYNIKSEDYVVSNPIQMISNGVRYGCFVDNYYYNGNYNGNLNIYCYDVYTNKSTFVTSIAFPYYYYSYMTFDNNNSLYFNVNYIDGSTRKTYIYKSNKNIETGLYDTFENLKIIDNVTTTSITTTKNTDLTNSLNPNYVYLTADNDTNNRSVFYTFDNFLNYNKSGTSGLFWKSIATSNIEYAHVYAVAQDNFIYYSTDSGINFNVTCFLEFTKITVLRNNVEVDVFVQDLLTFDLVKVGNNDYRKLIFLGYNFLDFKNINSVAKIPKNKLGNNLPNEDLYLLTGHSLLFDEIPDNIKNIHYKQIDANVYNNYKKILVLHTNIYETPDVYDLNICENNKIRYYHFALENDDVNQHYPVYANGVLTESMTIDFINKSNLFSM